MSTATYQREREPLGNNTKTQKKKNVYDSGLRKDMFTLFYGAAKVLNSSASCIKTVSPFFLCCKRVARQLQVKLFGINHLIKEMISPSSKLLVPQWAMTSEY